MSAPGAAALGHKLFSLDATVIDLCAAVFDWAKFRTAKGAVKLPPGSMLVFDRGYTDYDWFAALRR